MINVSNLFDNSKPDENNPVDCSCGWNGKIKDTTEKRITSQPDLWYRLSGREGFEYCCPRCNRIVYKYYFKVS